MSYSSITHKRRLVQALLIVSALLLPFVTIGSNPFLRMDIGLRTLFMAGIPVRVDQFYLVLLATLFLIALFLLITVILGRVWCGWLCPQTVFNDLAELIGNTLGTRVPALIAGILEHLVAVGIATLIAFNLLCWFMSPAQTAARLLHMSANPLVSGCFLVMMFFGYLNLIVVKRSFCRSYCPYGRFQAALLDNVTLNLAFREETRDRCIRCAACVKTCPMGIDIREGYQIECIGCGSCIDACRSVMERLPDGFGLIDYRFGAVKGARVKLGSKALALCALSLLLGGALVGGLIGRNQAAFVVQRFATAEPRTLPDGFQVQPWRATIGNRSESPQTYSIRAVPAGAGEVSLLGPVSTIPIAANEHREVTFMVKHRGHGLRSVQLQLVNGSEIVATAAIKP